MTDQTRAYLDEAVRRWLESPVDGTAGAPAPAPATSTAAPADGQGRPQQEGQAPGEEGATA
eukprot:6689032-Lingulodinium_polyedra.AAC.1